MRIGIPKEIKIAERRVALTPAACAKLIAAGHAVHLESRAGIEAGFSDCDYVAQSVSIEGDAKSLYRKATLIVKVKEPQPQEWIHLSAPHILFCFLHLAANPALTEALRAIGLTAVGFETVEEENGTTPLLAPMSAIAGRLAVQIGSFYLQTPHGGRGVLIGGTSDHPAGHVTVIGAGVAGTEAVALSLAMGAEVTLFDINPVRLETLHSQYPALSTRLSTPDAIRETLRDTDLLIGAVYIHGKRAPHVVRREDMKYLKPGAVVVDVSIDQGGCFETSRPCTYADPVYAAEGILHSAITNLPAAVPHTASEALSAAILPHVLNLAGNTWTPALRKGVNIEKNKLLLAF